MPTPILMPALSPTMTEGNLAKWLKNEGDAVKSGDVIAEIETDKATMEVEAVDEGTIGRILVQAGTEGVKVNEPIAMLLEEGEDASALEGGASPPPKQATQPSPAGGDASGGTSSQPATAKGYGDAGPVDGAVAPKSGPEAGLATPDAKAQPAAQKGNGRAGPPSTQPQPQAPARAEGERIFASPLARRMAEQSGLDLARVNGSGPHGRIVKTDVEAALARKPEASAPAATAAPARAEAPTAAAPQPAAGKGPEAARPPAVTQPTAPYTGNYEEIPLSSMRKVIAKRLTEAKQTIPHFYLSLDVELDALLAMRTQLNGREKADYKLSVNDFVIKAVAMGLRKVPGANAAWGGDKIYQYKDIDVSIAVAIDGGLITPIIRKADQKGLSTISNEMKDLAKRAKDGKLKPEEFQGGGFSISNLGMFGIRDFSAVINPPQACILAVGAGEQRPVVKGGELKVATVMTCTLSVDHRVVDGALGAQFLAEFKKLVEDPLALLL
jgi:pyruvate dehydrogenase E2 component (dihydrolipoamide acetyltransferase)